MKFNRCNVFCKCIFAFLVVVILFNLFMPTIVKADETGRGGIGGILFSPVQTLIVFLGDSALRILESIFVEDAPALITEVDPRSSMDWGSIIGYIDDGIVYTQELPVLGWIFDGLFGESTGYVDVPNIQISPQYIFTNKVDAFDINFFSPASNESPAAKLKGVVSYWYFVFRNIAIIGLLSVLVYIGIRIVIATTASDKSKYKMMIKDWIIALCLVFFMHYIMSGILTLSGQIVDAISKSAFDNEENVIAFTTKTPLNEGSFAGTYELKYHGDPILGMVRIRVQSGNFAEQFAYTLLYAVLVIYTIMFVIIYLKRIIHMAFFTIIAPLVALTYPLDKMKDKKAQAFEFWFKGYIFNATIQIFHLLIYYIVVGSAMQLAVSNPLYAIIAIGFLLPGEKILRKFFGLDRADTSGMLEGMASGAMVMQGINMLKKGVSNIGGGSKKEGEKEEKNTQIRTADSGNNTSKLMDDINGEALNKKTDSNDSEGKEGKEERTNSNQEEAKKTIRSMNVDTEDNKEDNEKDKKDSKDSKDSKENKDDKEAKDKKDKKDKKDNKKKRVMNLVARKYVKSAGKFVGRTAIKTYGAATLGTIGVAAGLASDKYSNIATFGIAGAAAGNAVAKSAMKSVKKLPSDFYRLKQQRNKIRDEAEKEIYTEKERKKVQNDRLDDEFMKDKQAKEKFKKAFDVKDPKEIMEEAKEYRRYGITDNDAIIKAMKLEVEGLKGRADKRRILTAKVAPQLGRKDIDNFGERLRSNGFSEEDIRIMQQSVRKYNDFE